MDWYERNQYPLHQNLLSKTCGMANILGDVLRDPTIKPLVDMRHWSFATVTTKTTFRSRKINSRYVQFERTIGMFK